MKLLIETGWGQWLSELTVITVALRLAIAAVCGALVGAEREIHGRAAGLRTHMMVALGSALTTLLGVFNAEVLGLTSADPMRVGAQVISGIGFLGAGAILLKKGNSQITGLTTAAGLWVTAIIGLAVGAGFYEGSLVASLFAMLIFTLISKLETLMNSKRQKLFVYLEIDDVNAVRDLTDILNTSFGAREIHVTPSRSGSPINVGIEVLIRIPKKVSISEKLGKLQALEHVVFALQL